MTDHVVIGITGNIACGKSTVDAMLQDLGAGYIVDADRVVHDLLASDVDVQQAVAARFGPQVLSTAGIDRRALGALVFADPRALHDLEEILHPRVRLRITAQLAALPAGTIAVVDAVKLLQGSLASVCTSRWWITAHQDQQLARLIEHRGLSRDEALRRIAAGPRLDDWRHCVDVVIDNSGSLDETRAQVEEAWRVATAPGVARR